MDNNERDQLEARVERLRAALRYYKPLLDERFGDDSIAHLVDEGILLLDDVE